MPSGYLHQKCAKEAAALSGIRPPREAPFILGAQGPDPLFMLGVFPLRASSKPGKLGNLLHTSRTGAFLCRLCQLAKGKGPVERAYAMGFLTHYALDSTVHPYVYAHSHKTNGEYDSLIHMQLEKRWDTLYFRRDGGRGTSMTMPGAAETREQWDPIGALWAEAIQAVYPEAGVTKETILLALAYTEKANRLTHSPTGIKYGLVWVLERLMGKPALITAQMAPRFLPKADLVNWAGAAWYAPAEPNRQRNEGLDQLYEQAVGRAGGLLTAAQGYFDGTLSAEAFGEIIGNAQYDTGMDSDA